MGTSTHGGKRAGSGRPRLKVKQKRIIILVPPTQLEKVDELCKREGVARTVFIRKAIHIALRKDQKEEERTNSEKQDTELVSMLKARTQKDNDKRNYLS